MQHLLLVTVAALFAFLTLGGQAVKVPMDPEAFQCALEKNCVACYSKPECDWCSAHKVDEAPLLSQCVPRGKCNRTDLNFVAFEHDPLYVVAVVNKTAPECTRAFDTSLSATEQCDPCIYENSVWCHMHDKSLNGTGAEIHTFKRGFCTLEALLCKELEGVKGLFTDVETWGGECVQVPKNVYPKRSTKGTNAADSRIPSFFLIALVLGLPFTR